MLADFAIDALAVRRLTRLVVEDEITYPLRVKALEIHSKLGYLVTCQMCTSVWAAGLVTVAPRKLRWALAASEAAILLGMSARLGELLVDRMELT